MHLMLLELLWQLLLGDKEGVGGLVRGLLIVIDEVKEVVVLCFACLRLLRLLDQLKQVSNIARVAAAQANVKHPACEHAWIL